MRSVNARRYGALVGDAPPARGEQTVLFKAPYVVGVETMYDVHPTGNGS